MHTIGKLFLTCALLAVSTVAEGFVAGGYRWERLNMAGRGHTDITAQGTSNDGWTVGRYFKHDGTGRNGAFVSARGRVLPFTLPDVRDAVGLEADDVARGLTIVGTYFQGAGELHAYLYRFGRRDHTIIDMPGAFWTFAFDVNDKGMVTLGFYAQPAPDETTWGAAVYDHTTRTHTPVTVFGLTEVLLGGINNHGDLTGLVTERPHDPCLCGVTHAFVRRQGEDLVIAHPDGWFVDPQGINDHGVIVGRLNHHGGFTFDLRTGAWQTLFHPQRVEGWTTTVADVSNQGQLVVVTERWSDGFAESFVLKPLD